MDFKELIKRLEGSETFKAWKKDNQDSFLAHVFVTPETEEYQVGYYNSKEDKVTSFMVKEEKIDQLPPSEVLKDTKTKIHPLEILKVKLSKEETMELADNLKEEEYENPPVMKVFFILQTIEDHPTFNITFFTLDMKTLNIKIDASSGEIIHHSLESLISMA